MSFEFSSDVERFPLDTLSEKTGLAPASFFMNQPRALKR